MLHKARGRKCRTIKTDLAPKREGRRARGFCRSWLVSKIGIQIASQLFACALGRNYNNIVQIRTLNLKIIEFKRPAPITNITKPRDHFPNLAHAHVTL
jgi:hypothetical protein